MAIIANRGDEPAGRRTAAGPSPARRHSPSPAFGRSKSRAVHGSRVPGTSSVRCGRLFGHSLSAARRAPCCRVALAHCCLVALLAAVANGDIVREEMEPSLRLDLPGHTGEVRALAFFPDGERLVSGGRDKVAIVWSLKDAADAAGTAGRAARQRERALRWQVSRGTRGAIQALAVSAGAEPMVAIAGSGAMGSTGEILLLRAADGTIVKTLGGGDRQGHRSSVGALDFTRDGRWLVSQDLGGAVFAWDRTADWQPVEVAGREEARFGRANATALARYPALRPLCAVGDTAVAFGAIAGDPAAPTPTWRVQVVDLAAPGRPARTLPQEHAGVITALAATDDGRRIVSADVTGKVFVMPATGDEAPVILSLPVGEGTRAVAESLAIGPDGRRVAVGVTGGSTRLEIWDAESAQRLVERPTAAPVRAVRISRDGRRIAWSGGADREVFVAALAEVGGATAPLVLGGVGRRITRIAFARAAAPPPAPQQRNIVRRRQPAAPLAAAPRRIAVAFGTPAAAPAPWEAAFDVESLALVDTGGDADWAPAAGVAAGWTIERAPVDAAPGGVQRWCLSRGGAAAGQIDLALEWEGPAVAGTRAVSWLTRPGADGPWAVALGTDRGISVYRLEAVPDMPCQLVRRFRGHEDAVLALAVSPDGGWLASGGGDGLVMLWSLSGLADGQPLTDRWGIDLAVRDGRAVVTAVDGAGPLAGRDVRVGDTITAISSGVGAAGEGNRSERVDAAGIRAALAEMPWSTQVTFTPSRAGQAADSFQRHPAWENVAALHLAANREWALWTPRGYYAASANGDTLFGWLVNRGLDRLPRFFRAQQFRRRLERPDVVSRLLVAGSLDAALEATRHDVPESSAIVLPRELAAAPAVRIIAPLAGTVPQRDRIAVVAEVEVPAGGELDRVTASVSGAVGAVPPRVEDLAAAPGEPRRRRYTWDSLPLPAEERHLVQVFAGTRAGPTGLEAVPIAAAPGVLRPARSRLFVLAAGVDRFPGARDSPEFEFPDLTYAVGDARAVRDALGTQTTGLFDVAFERLITDESVTLAGWQESVRDLAATLTGDVRPDDLLVIFIAGHGLINGGDAREYVYLCHDATVRADPSGAPVVAATGVVRWADFAPLAGIPCRKLAIVDTCHSGALGPGGRGTVVREFQEHQILVLAAAADDEPSLEDAAWGHGAFTKSLLEALGGQADRRGAAAPRPDGIVSLDEIIDYVLLRVPALARGQGAAQHPTVSPEMLVPYVRVPLTNAAAGGE